MLRMVWRQVTARLGRTLALALGIVVAATGFTVLTASARASQLETRGTVQVNAQTVYDILVRPTNTRSALEQSQGLVQPGFLTGLYGGISMSQWHAIQQIQGVAVAAPIEILGYAFPKLTVPISPAPGWSRQGDALARVDISWSWDDGLTHVAQVPDFALITSKRLRPNFGSSPYSHDGSWLVSTSTGSRDICPVNLDAARPDSRPESRQSRILCFSRTAGGDGTKYGSGIAGTQDVPIQFPLSYVVAAVDPASEDALVGLQDAVTSGEGLESAPTKYPKSATGRGVPVLVSDQIPTQMTGTITVSSLSQGAATKVLHGRGQKALEGLTGVERQQTVITAQDANRLLLNQFQTAKPVGPPGTLTRYLPGELWMLGQVSEPQVNLSASPPSVVLTRPGRPTVPQLSRDVQYQVPGSGELRARQIVTSYKQGPARGGLPNADTLYLRGTFDPAELAGLNDVTAQVLAGYDTAPTEGADSNSQGLLQDQPLAPSGFLGGFVQPPPTMLTTLDAAKILTDNYTNGHGNAPISAIRVRVAGVTGVDDLSRERVRLVAQRIQDETGLQVDITTGSSATRQNLTLPAGNYGRPELTLRQWWVKKGVAIAIINQLDKKSLALFLLVLLVSAVSVANSTVSSVRARRSDLGVMACLGWRPIHLFRAVLLELFMVALAAGALSSVLAWTLSRLSGTPVSLGRALLALPAALLVAAAAGMIPAWLAARAQPLDAVRTLADPPKHAQHISGLGTLARVGLGRVKTRTLLAAAGLAIAVAVFTVLLAITLAFQGAVVGTILGDAVAIQARGADYAATIATLVLAFLGVANVTYLNIRDRGSELATLRAVGWRPAHLQRLLVTEGVWIGVLGATPGAVFGLVLATAVTGTFSVALAVGALIAWTTAVLLSALAAALATSLIRRLPTTLLLTE